MTFAPTPVVSQPRTAAPSAPAQPTRPRAKPLPAGERRDRIVAAARSLVLEHGMDVTTRQLAQAAGVAEGTLFRVFRSKEELLLEAARSAFDATDHLAELEAVDPGADLEARLVAVIESAQRHARQVMRVFVAFGKPADRGRLGDHRDLFARWQAAQVSDRVVQLLEPDADRLRIPVQELARLLGMLARMSVHPLSEARPMTARQLADILLHGVLAGASTEEPLDLACVLEDQPTGKPLDPARA